MPVTIDNPSSVIRIHHDFFSGSTGETSANKYIFIADQPYTVQQAVGAYSVTGSTTINVGKAFLNASAGVTVGSAVPILSAAMNYAGGSAMIPLTGAVVASTTLSQLAINDALALVWTTANGLPPIGFIDIILQRT
jgi:hypothetical protein